MFDLSKLLSFEMVLLSLTAYAITTVVRFIVELVVRSKSFTESTLWRTWILHPAPIVLGALFASFAKQFPYPYADPSLSTRIALGAVAGLMSMVVYKAVKKLIRTATISPKKDEDSPST